MKHYINPITGDKYTYSHQIGKGACGVAKVVKDSEGTLYCMKEQTFKVNDNVDRHMVMKEIEMMKRTCSHPNVVAFYDSWWIRNDTIGILMELCTNGSLDKLIETFAKRKQRFTEVKVTYYLQELAGALSYCHETLGIIHRDIKPANILVDQLGTLKIADFGLSKHTGNQLCHTICGTPFYFAPELCRNSVRTRRTCGRSAV